MEKAPYKKAIGCFKYVTIAIRLTSLQITKIHSLESNEENL